MKLPPTVRVLATRAVLFWSSPLAALSCNVGPNYERPAVASPQSFRAPGALAAAERAGSSPAEKHLPEQPRASAFTDPCLHALLGIALDGDADVDLVVNSIGAGTHVFFNDGKGRFKLSEQILNPNRAGMSLAVADIEGDGDLDFYIANSRTTMLRPWYTCGPRQVICWQRTRRCSTGSALPTRRSVWPATVCV